MAKAVLIMDDMPECCADCACGYFERGSKELNLICGATGDDANNIGKPDWCPLRELPKKMEVCGKYPQPGKPVPSYRFGWNACLKAILGDK